MRFFRPLNSSVVARNLWLILLSKIWLLSNFSKHSQFFLKVEGFQIPLFVSLVKVVVELLDVLWFFEKLKFQNISETQAATWQLSYPDWYFDGISLCVFFTFRHCQFSLTFKRNRHIHSDSSIPGAPLG